MDWNWDTFKVLMDERHEHVQKALELQAKEYERRLEALNHAHENTQNLLHTFVRLDKYEDQTTSESEARKIALDRLDEKLISQSRRTDEKLDEYIKRYELRQREIDSALDISKGAVEAARQIADEQGRKNKEAAELQARKTNRNMALVTIALTIIIAISNWIGS